MMLHVCWHSGVARLRALDERCLDLSSLLRLGNPVPRDRNDGDQSCQVSLTVFVQHHVSLPCQAADLHTTGSVMWVGAPSTCSPSPLHHRR